MATSREEVAKRMLHGEHIARVLADLVRIESVNPDLIPGGRGERDIARYVANFLENAGLEVEVSEVRPGRFTTTGILHGRAKGKVLLLNGHLDTVGVEGMQDPFSPRLEDGRLYGRGAQDMKGGLAAALVALETLAKAPWPAGDVVLAAVADEEYRSVGTRALLEQGFRADAAIVLEPTGLEVVTAHKGFAWADIQTFGRASHGSRPQEGLDAIAFMGRVLREIERLQAALSHGAEHPLLGHGSVHASFISGGQELSSYPARCRLSLERRTIPGEDARTLERELAEIVARLGAEDANFRAHVEMGYSALPLETPQNSRIALTLLDCAREVVGARTKFGGQSFWTDAALLSEAGIPSVLLGPGGAGLHSAVEYVFLEDVRLCAETLVITAKKFCTF